MTASAQPGFVASPVVRVAVAALAAAEPGAATPRFDRPITRAEQAEVLERLCHVAGADGVILAGRQLRQIDPDPVVLVLLNSQSVEVLIEKVARLNRFLHSHHRQRVRSLTSQRTVLEHVSRGTEPPAPIESLFVAGLFVALVEMIGGVGVECRFPASPQPEVVVSDGHVVADVPVVGTHVWDIRWSSLVPRSPLPGLERLLLPEPGPDLATAGMSAMVRAVIRWDPARRWKLRDVADALAISPRTLQRRLSAEPTTFSSELAATRIDAAKALLGDPDVSVTEIGYRCGYSDTAHFSRSFRHATGVSPSGWRRNRGTLSVRAPDG